MRSFRCRDAVCGGSRCYLSDNDDYGDEGPHHCPQNGDVVVWECAAEYQDENFYGEASE